MLRTATAFLAAAFLATSACAVEAPTEPAERSDELGACGQDLDVVFVLDVSSSMRFALDKLRAEIDGVVASANGTSAEPHFGVIAYADNAAFGLGGAAGSNVHTEARTLKAALGDFDRLYTRFDRNPGDGPTGPTTQNPICEENALDALHLAATQFPWRPNAAHVVVVVTDDTFLEGGDNYGDRDGDGDTSSTDFPREGNYPAVFSYGATIDALKAAQARVFSVTRVTPGRGPLAATCGTGRRHATEGNDVVTLGWTKPFGDAPPIPAQTGGKNFDLDAVRAGNLSLATAIGDAITQTRCPLER